LAGHAQCHDPEAFQFEAGEDLAGVPRRHGVRLDDRKRTLQTHMRPFIFSPISAGEEQTVMPASSIARILSTAAPDPPEMIAPA
jgi:hypothetical protein